MSHDSKAPSAGSDRRRTILTVCALIIATLAIYTVRLGHVPIYLHHDEVWLALLGRSIARTARDPNGHLLPLYFPVFTREWFQPIPVYCTALILKWLPLSDWSARLPTVLVAAADVVLMYFVARRAFEREALAVIAAAALLLTPAHFIHGRLGMDYLYPVPFLLAWILCLLWFFERPRLRTLFAATTCLGLGFYSYIAAMFMMPMYLLITLGALWTTGNRRWAAYAAAVLGFALPLLLLVPWLLGNPTMFAQLLLRYDLSGGSSPSAVQGLQSWLGFDNAIHRASIYWDFFNPAYLFLSGGSNVMNSTRQAGVFLWPLAVFLVAGLWRAVNRRSTITSVLWLAGFLSAPAAAALILEPYAIDRELEVLPFGILLATGGIDAFLGSTSTIRRGVGVCLLALIPLLFSTFSRDYFGGYGPRTSVWFERNVPGALEAIIQREREEPTTHIYLSRGIRWVDDKWKLSLITHGREDLLERTRYFDADLLDPGSIPKQSLVLTPAGDASGDALARADGFRQVARITEPDGEVSFSLFVKN